MQIFVVNFKRFIDDIFTAKEIRKRMEKNFTKKNCLYGVNLPFAKKAVAKGINIYSTRRGCKGRGFSCLDHTHYPHHTPYKRSQN